MVQKERKPHRKDDQDDVDEATETSQTSDDEVKEGLDEDVTSMLDEIDGVLENNAEDFVAQFIQKGGQ